jgi:hypothetical protein
LQNVLKTDFGKKNMKKFGKEIIAIMTFIAKTNSNGTIKMGFLDLRGQQG